MHRVLLPFEFVEPATLEDVIESLDGEKTRVLAGGVDLVLKMRLRQVVPDKVVSLQKVTGLHYVCSEGGFLRFGALATLWELERDREVRENWPLLAEAISSIVSKQTKVMGTAVGNLCVGTPASDVAPALYALGARVRLVGEAGGREIPIEKFFLASGTTAVLPGEIVTEVTIPAPAPAARGAFLKLSKTFEDIAKVNVATMLTFAGRECVEARIAVGSVAPTPLRLPAAEQALVGGPLSPERIEAAADRAAAVVAPISDVRSTAAYRREMVRVLVRDAVASALSRATAGKEA
jgi:aerobic carbon-monoxide dehydrogenase medium subunit